MMGFNKVYRTLQEIFPQIDARALRAVAIEHSKDADAAVEAVLVEIIPFFTERSTPSSPSVKSVSEGTSSSAPAVAAQPVDQSLNQLSYAEVVNGYPNGGSQLFIHGADEGQSELFYDSHDGYRDGDNSTKVNADVHTQAEPVVLVDNNGLNTLQIEVSGVLETEEILVDKHPESSTVDVPCQTLETLQDVCIDSDHNMKLIHEKEDREGPLETGSATATNQEKDQGNSCPDGNHSTDGPASLTIHDETQSTLESVVQSVVLKPVEENLSTETDSVTETTSNIVVIEDESSLKASLSQSSQIHIIDVLHEIIEDARNHKKTLSSSKESVVSLMKEVELKEIAAKEAEEEATKGDADIWVKVEELKQMLQHAKEANDMHAGEVYGEKAILGTELRELQSRVLSMADERDKYLAVLDKMRQTLEERLAAAENKIASAEHEKQRREKSAREALAEQELIMEKVVQESNTLKQQAEDNAKLREFLVDRGRVVDILQGEISVVCQDIKLLKEKYEENVPFTKSLFSSQTSSFLGSSGSSSRSMVADQVEPVSDKVESPKTDPTSCSDGRVFEEEEEAKDEARDDRKALIDDGWDFFDKNEGLST